MNTLPNPLQPAELLPPYQSRSQNRYVYSVISRRSGGLSIGINLNPDQVCNFDCIYCQVDRTQPRAHTPVELERLAGELRATLQDVRCGALFQRAPFDQLPPPKRRVRDIAFAGDGEPTSCKLFPEAVDLVIETLHALDFRDVGIVLITNATLLRRPSVRAALARMDQHGGEIWAKLDAGTDAYFHRINRGLTGLDEIVENIADAARVRPVVIQTMCVRLDHQSPEFDEIDALCDRVRQIQSRGGQIKLMQLYTVARRPAEHNVAALADVELDDIADRVRSRLNVPLAVFYSRGAM